LDLGEQQRRQQIAHAASHADDIGLDRLGAELLQDRGDGPEGLDRLDRLLAVVQARRDERPRVGNLTRQQPNSRVLVERSVIGADASARPPRIREASTQGYKPLATSSTITGISRGVYW